MSNRTQNLARVLFGCLLLAACNDDVAPEDGDHAHDAGHHDDGDEDAAANDDEQDAGVSHTDGGKTGSDAGKPHVDAGGEPVAEAHFFLSTGDEGDNISPPTVVLDAHDNAHFVYPGYAGGGAYYAYCGAGTCNRPEDMEVVRFETEGTAYNTMIALTAEGQPRVLIAAYYGVYYATCDAGCGDAASWSIDEIVHYTEQKEVTGQAFALDANGHPRFLMHTYRALWGIGQVAPHTELVGCDALCDRPESWTSNVLGDVIWYGSALRFDAQNGVHVATTFCPYDGVDPQEEQLVYFRCNGECTNGDNYEGIGFGKPYESTTEAVSMKFMTDLELTKSGRPRVAIIAGTDVKGEKAVLYGECADGKDCGTDGDAWAFYAISKHAVVGAGTDLALDANDHPRIAYTFNYNILMQSCNEHCTENVGGESPWDDSLVESADSIPADDIFLWPNCNIGAWLLSSPSVAIGSDGSSRVAYEARDISGGFTSSDPTQPACTAGTDMVLGRVSFVPN